MQKQIHPAIFETEDYHKMIFPVCFHTDIWSYEGILCSEITSLYAKKTPQNHSLVVVLVAILKFATIPFYSRETEQAGHFGGKAEN